MKWTRYTWEQEELINIKLRDLLDQFWSEHGGDPNSLVKEKSSVANEEVAEKEEKVSTLF